MALGDLPLALLSSARGCRNRRAENRRLNESLNQVDLHCHTTASDGTFTPAALVERAARLALKVIAVTDHDTTDGVAEAIAARQRLGVEVIPGVEINTDVIGGEVHVLGYFIDRGIRCCRTAWPGCARAGSGARAASSAPWPNWARPSTSERVLQIAGEGAVGRPHVAQALIEAGHVSTFNEAFDRYIGRNSPGLHAAREVHARRRVPPDPANRRRARAGPPRLVWPRRRDQGASRDLDRMLPSLIAAGLMGIEVYYPGYDALTTEFVIGAGAAAWPPAVPVARISTAFRARGPTWAASMCRSRWSAGCGPPGRDGEMPGDGTSSIHQQVPAVARLGFLPAQARQSGSARVRHDSPGRPDRGRGRLAARTAWRCCTYCRCAGRPANTRTSWQRSTCCGDGTGITPIHRPLHAWLEAQGVPFRFVVTRDRRGR